MPLHAGGSVGPLHSAKIKSAIFSDNACNGPLPCDHFTPSSRPSCDRYQIHAGLNQFPHSGIGFRPKKAVIRHRVIDIGEQNLQLSGEVLYRLHRHLYWKKDRGLSLHKFKNGRVYRNCRHRQKMNPMTISICSCDNLRHYCHESNFARQKFKS